MLSISALSPSRISVEFFMFIAETGSVMSFVILTVELLIVAEPLKDEFWPNVSTALLTSSQLSSSAPSTTTDGV